MKSILQSIRNKKIEALATSMIEGINNASNDRHYVATVWETPLKEKGNNCSVNMDSEFERNESIETFIDSYLKNVERAPELEISQATRMCFYPATNVIALPEKNKFKSSEAYYYALMHELAHSTGHHTKFKRDAINNPFRTNAEYGQEELIAELTSLFLLQCAGILTEQRKKNSEIYMKCFLLDIENENRKQIDRNELFVLSLNYAIKDVKKIVRHFIKPQGNKKQSVTYKRRMPQAA